MTLSFETPGGRIDPPPLPGRVMKNVLPGRGILQHAKTQTMICKWYKTRGNREKHTKIVDNWHKISTHQPKMAFLFSAVDASAYAFSRSVFTARRLERIDRNISI